MTYISNNARIKFEKILNDVRQQRLLPPPHFFDPHPLECSLLELRNIWITCENASLAPRQDSVYIHVPFCSSRCAFCMYDSMAISSDTISPYIARIVDELGFWKDEIHQPLSSLYIGGGTPSLMSMNDITLLFGYLNRINFLPNSSRTFELSPQSTDNNKLKALANTIINRVSIGVQSFDRDVLRINKRLPATVDQIGMIVSSAVKLGFADVNIDLMVGLEGQTINNVEDTTRQIISVQPPSITVYTYRDVNGLSRLNHNTWMADTRKQLETLIRMLEAAGYIHVAGSIDTEYNTFRSINNTSDLTRHPTSINSLRNVHLFGLGAHANGFNPAIAYTCQSSALPFMSNESRFIVYRHSPLQQMQQAVVSTLYCNNMQIDDAVFHQTFGCHFEEVFATEMEQLYALGRVRKDGTAFKFVFNSEYEAETIRRYFWNEGFLLGIQNKKQS